MNRAILTGNLVADPTMKVTQNGNNVCTFRIGVSSGYGDKQQTAFLHIVCFGKTAENCDRYLAKGRKVAVEGRIVTGSYENKEGRKVYTTDIYADSVEFLNSESGSSEQRNAKAKGEIKETVDDMSGFAALDASEGLPF